jgi:hypothetical protein
MTAHSAGHRQAPYVAAPHAICLSGWLSQPDTRYFFGVADRTEPSHGQGFQYDRLVGSIVLYEAGLENTILNAPMLEQHGALAVPARLGASRRGGKNAQVCSKAVYKTRQGIDCISKPNPVLDKKKSEKLTG